MGRESWHIESQNYQRRMVYQKLSGRGVNVVQRLALVCAPLSHCLSLSLSLCLSLSLSFSLSPSFLFALPRRFTQVQCLMQRGSRYDVVCHTQPETSIETSPEFRGKGDGGALHSEPTPRKTGAGNGALAFLLFSGFVVVISVIYCH